MAERKQTEQSGSEPAPDSQDALPEVESPSISPAEAKPFTETAEVVVDAAAAETAEAKPDAAASPSDEDAAEATLTPEKSAPNFSLPRIKIKVSARARRSAVSAASVALAAGFGAVIGALASSSFIAAPKPADTAGLVQREAMQEKIAQLTTEITALKTGIETANSKSEPEPTAFSERMARVEESLSAPETTGSIPGPVPLPRPAPGVPPEFSGYGNLPVVRGWVIRAVRNGHILVYGQGETFDVVPGAPLPGLGRIETIKQIDGRWVVVTPKGLITARRDRAYFERL